MFGMKAYFPEAETHALVGKDFGVPDCQGRGVLSPLAPGAQLVDAAVTRAWSTRPTIPDSWVCLKEVRKRGAAQREVTWRAEIR